MQLIEVEQREAYGRERMEALAAEVSRLQIHMTKLNAQSYVKDESILGLQQQVNNLLTQVNAPSYSSSKAGRADFDSNYEETPRSLQGKGKTSEFRARDTEDKYKDNAQQSHRESTRSRELKEAKEDNKMGGEAERKATERRRAESSYQPQQKIEDKEKIVKNIENKLLSLQIEKKTVFWW